MDRVSETWVTSPKRPVSMTSKQACLVHIYPTGPGMGTRYPLGDAPIVLGRGNDCDIRINDHSVSRRHARIQPGADGYYAVDLQSTNGTFVNDVAGRHLQAQGRRLPARRQLHLSLPGRRQRRGRVPRGNLPPDHHRRPDRHPQQALPAGVPRPRAGPLGPLRPAAVADHDRHRPLQGHQRRAGPPGRRLHPARAGRLRQGQRPQGGAVRPLRRRGVRAGAAGNRSRAAPWSWPSASAGWSRAASSSTRASSSTSRSASGVATTTGEEPMTPTDLIRRADEKLFEAKRAGRNQVHG